MVKPEFKACVLNEHTSGSPEGVSESPGGLVEAWIAGPTPRAPDSVVRVGSGNLHF